jgi:hypothetical protein
VCDTLYKQCLLFLPLDFLLLLPLITAGRFRLGAPGAIRSRASAKCMHLASITPSTPVTMQPCSNTTNQNQWVRSFAGSMELRVGATGLCLDLGGSSSANGTPLLVNTCNNTNQQRFFYDRQGEWFGPDSVLSS